MYHISSYSEFKLKVQRGTRKWVILADKESVLTIRGKKVVNLCNILASTLNGPRKHNFQRENLHFTPFLVNRWAESMMTALSTTIRFSGCLFILVLRSHSDLGFLAGPETSPDQSRSCRLPLSGTRYCQPCRLQYTIEVGTAIRDGSAEHVRNGIRPVENSDPEGQIVAWGEVLGI